MSILSISVEARSCDLRNITVPYRIVMRLLSQRFLLIPVVVRAFSQSLFQMRKGMPSHSQPTASANFSIPFVPGF